MKKILPFVLLPLLALPAFAGDDGASAPPASPQPAAPAAKDGKATPPARGRTGPDDADRKHRSGLSEEDEAAFYKKLTEETPELKGVNAETPEGKKQVRAYLDKKHKTGEMPEVSAMMKVMRAKSHAKIRKIFGMPQEEFAAIEPMLGRVEQLQAQKLFVDIPMTMKSLGVDDMNPGSKEGVEGFIKVLLGSAPVDPAIQEYQDAGKALKTILEDAQANAAEQADAIARVRKARTAYRASLEKAQLELRGVLTPRQEALLVDYGILD